MTRISLGGPVLRDTARLSQRYPPNACYAAMGFLVSQHGQWGAIPPPPFLRISPLESMRSGGAIPPPQNGYLSDTCAIPHENKANGCDTPSAILSRRGLARYGGVSRSGPLRYFLEITLDMLRAQLHPENTKDMNYSSTKLGCWFL